MDLLIESNHAKKPTKTDSISITMKKICILLLFISLGGNIVLGITLQTFHYNLNQNWKTLFNNSPPIYPIIGLPSTDLKQIINQIGSTAKNPAEYKNILMVEILDNNSVEIIMGEQENQLAGKGVEFLFSKKSTKWILENERMIEWGT
jgi:hypothetical protein